MKQEIEILFSINQPLKEAAKLLTELGAEKKGGKHTVDEYELEITDGETMKQALLRQHYQPLVTIDSHKTKYQWEDYEFTLEEVKDLGTFLEVEYTTDATTPIAAIKDTIRTLAKEIGFTIDEELTIGKPELMLRKIGQ